MGFLSPQLLLSGSFRALHGESAKTALSPHEPERQSLHAGGPALGQVAVPNGICGSIHNMSYWLLCQIPVPSGLVNNIGYMGGLSLG